MRCTNLIIIIIIIIIMSFRLLHRLLYIYIYIGEKMKPVNCHQAASICIVRLIKRRIKK